MRIVASAPAEGSLEAWAAEVFDAERAAVAYCDVSTVPADAATVDALARLQLAAKRYRCRVRLRNASDELLRLVAFMGLADVLPE